MAAVGIPAVSWCLSRHPPRVAPMETALWTLQWSGLAIALVGISRERWLRARRQIR
jgi:hypothetical protein